MNKVTLMGNLTRDPDVRYSQGEKSTCVARYTLGIRRRFHRDGDPDSDFINCVAFGKQGEFVKIGSAVPRTEALTVAALVAHIIHVDDLMLLHARNNQRDIGSVGAYLNTVFAVAVA